MPSHKPKPHWGKRIGWLLLIWLASISALAGVSLLIKGLMTMAGLKS